MRCEVFSAHTRTFDMKLHLCALLMMHELYKYELKLNRNYGSRNYH
jgi:hypothetical protein